VGLLTVHGTGGLALALAGSLGRRVDARRWFVRWLRDRRCPFCRHRHGLDRRRPCAECGTQAVLGNARRRARYRRATIAW